MEIHKLSSDLKTIPFIVFDVDTPWSVCLVLSSATSP